MNNNGMRINSATSDFGLVVGDTIGRTLRAAYQAAPVGIRRLGRQTTARDFRTVNKIMLGEAPMLEKLNEHGEIQAGTMAEAKETYKVETFARKIGVTRQVLVNDDLGAFADLSRRMGQAAAETEAKTLVDLLEANSGNGPTMEDGDTLFHNDHGNKAAAGGAIADATLSAARLAMRSQTGLSGQRISATPKYLLVPPAQETTALLKARYAGLRIVEYDGRRVSYATDAEMATALADLERRIAAAQSGRVSQVRIQSTKGV
jgi:hypothetical protein